MTPDRRSLLAAAAAAAAGAVVPPLVAPSASAQPAAFPTRPVRIVVPFAAGGAVDITGRLLAERLPPHLGGQSVVVDNRGGAGGNLGADAVAKAEPDGHTILLGTATILSANKFLYRRSMPFDPARDLAPVTRVTTGTILLVVNANRPWRTLDDLLAAARREPGRITMGSSGTGTVSHLALASLNRAAGVDITHVPYRGGGPAIADLLAGTIDMMFDVIPALMPHVREGRFRPLAAGSAEPIAYVPELREVPGMRAALPSSGLDLQSWYAVCAPAGTPGAAIATLHRALVAVASSDDFRARMEPLGFTPVWDESPAALAAYMRAQEEVWRGLVEASGATLD